MDFPDDMTAREFWQRIKEETGDDPRINQLHSFHEHLRQDSNVGSGTLVDYIKDLAGKLGEDGELPDDVEESTAVRKYRKFKSGDKKVKPDD